ncbi:hypothetical protein B296_00036342 [Ensete ventricosum]|uniref:SAC domain-containing protein n=1 Tax=Ensete ventricosum TaxID=4639 RepID=A0A426ZD81_ENSVE|nr:hypothetical protein B296_00036342 [Ensete ventricosum]
MGSVDQMSADSETADHMAAAGTGAAAGRECLQKFRLYETRSMFYIVGSNKNRAQWRVLKIDRSEPAELTIREDPTTYSASECYDLLKRVHEGNISTGGLRFVTKCYGIAGMCSFVVFHTWIKLKLVANPSAKLSISGKDFRLTLIARRSRHFAGTRYLKRGVNEKGRVANDVETEQIVFEDSPEEIPSEITSVVQNRGSIPLFWSQETSKLNIRPDIICKF